MLTNLFDPPLQISHSSIELFNTCERKYQLTKLLENSHVKEDAPHFSKGHAFGAMVQHYMLTGSEDQALFQAWLAYEPELEDPTKGITLASTIGLFDKVRDQLDLLRLDWEVAWFNGHPAIELSFKLIINENFIYIGFVDLVLQHRISRIYGVMEVKTTSLSVNDVEPLFKNSAQALIYSVILDAVAGEEQASADLIYPILQDVRGNVTFHVKTFRKTLLDRLHAFISIGLDVERITRCEELGVYPRRGSKCLAWNRPCIHFGTCNLQAADKPAVRLPNNDPFDFTFKLDEIVADHLRRVQK